MSWQLIYTRDAEKDSKHLGSSSLKQNADALLKVLSYNPFQNPPPYEKLSGELFGYYSRRINRKHRLVYQVFKSERVVKVISMWTHYE